MHSLNSKNKRFVLNCLTGSVLVETVVAVSVFLLLLGLVFAILSSGKGAWQTEDITIQLQQELRKAMVTMTEDLRQTRANKVDIDADNNWYTSITFRKPTGVAGSLIVWSSPIQFLLGGLDNQQLLKSTDSGDEVIANDISSLLIRRQSSSPQVIEVALSATKDTPRGRTIQKSMDFKVKMRN